MEFTIYGGCICPLCGWVMEITSGGDMMRCGNGSCELRSRRFARPTVECREIDPTKYTTFKMGEDDE